MLGRVGIDSVGQLKAMGTVATYLRLKQAGEAASLPLLYALEAGVSGCRITDISAARRAELVAVVASHQPHVPGFSAASHWAQPADDVAQSQSERDAPSRRQPKGMLE